MRVPRPVKWMLLAFGLLAGWVAGQLLDEKAATGGTGPGPSSARAVEPATQPGTGELLKAVPPATQHS